MSQETLGLRLVKLTLSTIAIIAIVLMAYPRIEDYLAYSTPLDQGSRGLIVVSSSGSEKEYSLIVRSKAQRDGTYTVTFYFTAKDITYESGGESAPIDVRVTFAGEGFGASVSCGTSPDPISRQEFTNLAEGAQHAVLVDAVGGSSSALNYDADSQGDEAEKARSLKYPVYQGRLWLLNEGTVYNRRSANGDNGGTIWAETCTLPASSVWHGVKDGSFAGAGRTLLPPQINWTSIGKATDHQQDIKSSLVVERREGVVLSESYPPVQISDDTWSYANQVNWIGKKGEERNLGYTDQPVLIFADREAADGRALFLMSAGVALGIVASLILYVIAGIIDLAWSRFRTPR